MKAFLENRIALHKCVHMLILNGHIYIFGICIICTVCVAKEIAFAHFKKDNSNEQLKGQPTRTDLFNFNYSRICRYGF